MLSRGNASLAVEGEGESSPKCSTLKIIPSSAGSSSLPAWSGADRAPQIANAVGSAPEFAAHLNPVEVRDSIMKRTAKSRAFLANAFPDLALYSGMVP